MAVGPAVRLTAVVLAAVSASVSAVSVSPVQKVIQLITDMENKAKQEKNAEAVEFSAFQQFCSGTIASKDAEIKKQKGMMETLAADIAKTTSDINEASDKIDELNTFKDKCNTDLDAATKQRAKEKADYAEQVADFSESVDALDRAVDVLSKQNYDRKQAEEALLQLTSSGAGVSESVHRTVAAFLEMNTGDDYLTRDAPEASGYEFQSGGILDLLKKLKTEFTEKKSEAEKAGMNSAAAFDMLQQDLHDSIEGATSDISDKTEYLEEKKQLKAEDTKRLTVATKDNEEDVVYHSDLTVECDEKSKSFEEKQDLRSEELEALAKAKEILASGDVSGAAETHLPTLVQTAATSLAQLRASKGQEPNVRRALESFLRNEGMRLKSQSISMLAQKVASYAANGGPFDKVKKMIDQMITKLIKEAGEESEHKGWCDTEVGTNKITRTKLASSIDGLVAKIDESEASLTEMSNRISQLSKEISELQTAMTEATGLRKDESAKNAVTVEDAQAAQKAVVAAVAVLKDFYEKAGDATAFVQVANEPVRMGSEEWNALANPNAGPVDKNHKAGMQTFGKTYSGQQDEAGGVLAMLEVISSDFSRLEAETEAAETTSADQHKSFMAESSKNKAVKEKESEMLTADSTNLQAEMLTDKKDLANTQDQLLAADRYYEKLKPQCIDLGMSYGERAAAREEEIQSLKEALTILRGEGI